MVVMFLFFSLFFGYHSIMVISSFFFSVFLLLFVYLQMCSDLLSTYYGYFFIFFVGFTFIVLWFLLIYLYFSFIP